MDDIITLRRELHANPELSGAEQKTARRIAAVFQELNPNETDANLGGNGIAFVFDSRQPGPSILFRCELDAIAVHEGNDLAYRSLARTSTVRSPWQRRSNNSRRFGLETALPMRANCS